MRLSDILKKTSQGVAPVPVKEEKQDADKIKPAIIDAASVPKEQTVVPVKTPVVSIPVVAPVKKAVLDANEVYTKAIVEVKNIFSCLEKNKTLPTDIKCIPEIANLLEHKNEEIVLLTNKSTPDVHLYGHSLNTCILSLLVANSLNLPKSLNMNLAYCALLHDFTKNDPKHHDRDVLKHIPELIESIKTTVMDISSHGKTNNTFKFELIDESQADIFAQLIALVSVYDALIHPGSHRNALIPHEAMKTVINASDEHFDTPNVKAFVEIISIYPLGSYVRLNTNEIARIVGINPGLPTRPKVSAIIDPLLRKYAKPKLINLATTPMVHIKEAIDETKLELTDKKLALELKASRWWVKGI